MPMKLARTVASSVCGRISHWRSATITAITAAPTIPTPSKRPMTRRAPGSDGTCSSDIGLAPEENHPEHQGDENSETRVNQRWRAHIGIKPGTDTQPSSQQRRPNPDHGAEHPRREKRTDNIDLRPHRTHLMSCFSNSSHHSRVIPPKNLLFLRKR